MSEFRISDFSERRSEISVSSLSANDGEDVRLSQDQERVAIEGDLGSAVLSVEDLVADLHFHRHSLVLLEAARARSDDFALLRLLLGGVGNVETAAHLLRLFERLDDDAVRQRVDLDAALGGHDLRPSGSRVQ